MADLEKRLGIKFEYVWAYDADDLTDEDYARVDDSMSPKVFLTYWNILTLNVGSWTLMQHLHGTGRRRTFIWFVWSWFSESSGWRRISSWLVSISGRSDNKMMIDFWVRWPAYWAISKHRWSYLLIVQVAKGEWSGSQFINWLASWSST